MSSENTSQWNPDSYYGISRWSEGYFGVNSKGNVAAYTGTGNEGIDFMDIIEEMKAQNIQFPAVIRFHDILRDRVKSLNKAFSEAIDHYDYDGSYTGVFPIKVNQMREVVEEVVDAGSRYNYGLEAGSKPELLAVLAYNKNRNSLTVLNGYKDRDYIRLALLGNKMGRNCCIVVENFSEVFDIIEMSKEMKTKPMIGLRAKLSAKSRGKWASSSGDRAKFGLTIPEILNTVQLLKTHKMEDSIKLFHFHIGSQISDIGIFKEAISEGARIFSKLCKMNLNLEYFDVGGGLGVDYDGTKSKNDSSRNYNLSEYASDIVSTLKDICDEEGVDHPNIVSESGRAISAHHSCVITNVLGTIQPYNDQFDTKKKTGEHSIVRNIREAETLLKKDNYQEMFNDAMGYREDCINAFKLGILSLEERAKVETIYWRILHKVNEITQSLDFVSEEFYELGDQLAKHYLCNFSVFQSTADIWAVGQLLPLLPIHRLNEEPAIDCTIADITCDSDGKITQFISAEEGSANTIRLHQLNDDPYYVGLFLTGAYQDVMGDMHNLFGRLNEVHVFYDSSDESNFYIEEVIRGSSSEMVLSTMQYNPDYMAARVKKIIDKRIKAGKIAPREGVRLNDFYEDCLKDYTYLKND